MPTKILMFDLKQKIDVDVDEENTIDLYQHKKKKNLVMSIE